MYSFLRRFILLYFQFMLICDFVFLFVCTWETISKLHRFTLFNVRNYYTMQRLAVKVHTRDSMCVGSFTSCSISFTLNRCDLTRVAQGYQAVTRIHLPSPGLAWPGLVAAHPNHQCAFSSLERNTLLRNTANEQALVGFDPVRHL